MLPHLEQHGWSAVVLCVSAEDSEDARDTELLRTVPAVTEVVTCRAIPERWTRRLGFGSLALRSALFLGAAGDRLLRAGGFDLVFFSTTEFGVLSLGPRWLRRFGVPFVVDLHDPWVNPYYVENNVRPPGGRFKHTLHQAAARRQEERVLRNAAHIIAVSREYPPSLMRRYSTLPESRFSVVPFGGARRDFEFARQTGSVPAAISPVDGRRNWVYAGNVNPAMFKVIRAFFFAFRTARESGILDPDSVHLHFVGTDYAPGKRARGRVAQLAKECGVADNVHEYPERVGYLETARWLLNADALLVFGSEEPGYTASKLYPYILAEKPLLTVFHEASSVTDVMRETSAGVSVTFGTGTPIEEIARRVMDSWFVPRRYSTPPATSWEAFHRYSAESMTERVARIFDGAALARPAI